MPLQDAALTPSRIVIRTKPHIGASYFIGAPCRRAPHARGDESSLDVALKCASARRRHLMRKHDYCQRLSGFNPTIDHSSASRLRCHEAYTIKHGMRRFCDDILNAARHHAQARRSTRTNASRYTGVVATAFSHMRISAALSQSWRYCPHAAVICPWQHLARYRRFAMMPKITSTRYSDR